MAKQVFYIRILDFAYQAKEDEWDGEDMFPNLDENEVTIITSAFHLRLGCLPDGRSVAKVLEFWTGFEWVESVDCEDIVAILRRKWVEEEGRRRCWYQRWEWIPP